MSATARDRARWRWDRDRALTGLVDSSRDLVDAAAAFVGALRELSSTLAGMTTRRETVWDVDHDEARRAGDAEGYDPRYAVTDAALEAGWDPADRESGVRRRR